MEDTTRNSLRDESVKRAIESYFALVVSQIKHLNLKQKYFVIKYRISISR